MSNKLSNLDSIRSEILSKGYYVYKNFVSSDDCILLREVISKKIHISPEHSTRINSKAIYDYWEGRKYGN